MQTQSPVQIIKMDINDPYQYCLSGTILFLLFPVYAQNIPIAVRNKIKQSELHFSFASILCTYGGVDAGAALQNAAGLLKKAGITKLVSAAEFSAKHSYHCTKAFSVSSCSAILNKFVKSTIENVKSETTVTLPHRVRPAAVLPQRLLARLAVKLPVNNENCTNCGMCIKYCPVHAIDMELQIDKSKCIRCAACINHCKNNARILQFRLGITKAYLQYHTAHPKAPLVFD